MFVCNWYREGIWDAWLDVSICSLFLANEDGNVRVFTRDPLSNAQWKFSKKFILINPAFSTTQIRALSVFYHGILIKFFINLVRVI
jgi:hypothetical protein